jgi:hypothetical protein
MWDSARRRLISPAKSFVATSRPAPGHWWKRHRRGKKGRHQPVRRNTNTGLGQSPAAAISGRWVLSQINCVASMGGHSHSARTRCQCSVFNGITDENLFMGRGGFGLETAVSRTQNRCFAAPPPADATAGREPPRDGGHADLLLLRRGTHRRQPRRANELDFDALDKRSRTAGSGTGRKFSAIALFVAVTQCCPADLRQILINKLYCSCTGLAGFQL